MNPLDLLARALDALFGGKASGPGTPLPRPLADSPPPAPPAPPAPVQLPPPDPRRTPAYPPQGTDDATAILGAVKQGKAVAGAAGSIASAVGLSTASIPGIVGVAGPAVAIAAPLVIGAAIVTGLTDDPVDDLHVAELMAEHSFDPEIHTYETVKHTQVVVGGFRGTVFDEDSITIVYDAAHPPGSPPVTGISGPYMVDGPRPRPKPVASPPPPRPTGSLGSTIVRNL